MIAGALAIDEDRTITRAADLALHAHRREVVGGTDDRGAGRVLGFVGLDVERADVQPAILPLKRVPAMMSIGTPVADRPMRRVKK